MDRRIALGPSVLPHIKAEVRESLTYDYDDPPDTKAEDWARWWNLFAPQAEWMIGRVGATYEPNPDVEDVKVSCRVWADGDAGVPITESVQIKGFSWAKKDDPQRWLVKMMATSMICTLHRVCRLMRQRQNHGLLPALSTGLFKYKSYKGVGGACIQYAKQS